MSRIAVIELPFTKMAFNTFGKVVLIGGGGVTASVIAYKKWDSMKRENAEKTMFYIRRDHNLLLDKVRKGDITYKNSEDAWTNFVGEIALTGVNRYPKNREETNQMFEKYLHECSIINSKELEKYRVIVEKQKEELRKLEAQRKELNEIMYYHTR